MDNKIEVLISFLKEIEKFKTIERKTFNSNGRSESDAEHAWHLAMFIILFEKDMPANTDLLKMLKMAMVHDLVEIYAGDTFLFDKEANKDKKERELMAANKLFSLLPVELEKEFHAIFDEFESGTSAEAKIVLSFDKIQAILQNICSEGKGWKDNKIKYDEVDSYKRHLMLHDTKVLEIYEKLMNEAKEKGFLT